MEIAVDFICFASPRLTSWFNSLISWLAGDLDILYSACLLAHLSRVPLASFSARFLAISAAIKFGCVCKTGISPGLRAGSSVTGWAGGELLALRSGLACVGTGVRVCTAEDGGGTLVEAG